MIISESNLNDCADLCDRTKIDLNEQKKHIYSLYKLLSLISTKIVVLILPIFNISSSFYINNKLFHLYKEINNFHRACAYKFKFNLIDIDFYFNCYNIIAPIANELHEIGSLYYLIGYNISDKYNSLHKNQSNSNYELFKYFKVCCSEEIKIYNDSLDDFLFTKRDYLLVNKENSQFNRNLISIKNKVFIPSNYINCYLLSLEAWNFNNEDIKLSDSIFSGIEIGLSKRIIKYYPNYLQHYPMKDLAYISEGAYIKYVDKFKNATEPSQHVVYNNMRYLSDFKLASLFCVEKSFWDNLLIQKEVLELINLQKNIYTNQEYFIYSNNMFNFIPDMKFLYLSSCYFFNEFNNTVKLKKLQHDQLLELNKQIEEKKVVEKEYKEHVENMLKENNIFLKNIQADLNQIKYSKKSFFKSVLHKFKFLRE